MPPILNDPAKDRSAVSFRDADLCGLKLATEISSILQAPCLSHPYHAGCIDVSRPLDNRKLFGRFAKSLNTEDRNRLLESVYQNYHQTVQHAIERILQQFTFVVHLSVRSFAPIKKGRRIRTDVGLLYDPSRSYESDLCMDWIDEVYFNFGNLRVRRNYPARGTRNGLLGSMREQFSPEHYLGIEIWVNRWWANRQSSIRDEAVYELSEGLRMTIGLPVCEAA